MRDAVLRQVLGDLLAGGLAYGKIRGILEGIDPLLCDRRPREGSHTLFEELEHMRIAQEDILRYTLDPEWKSPVWPEGYWPSQPKADPEQWEHSLRAFLSDLEDVAAFARRGSPDLTDTIPHGEGRTYLRQILLVADHNAYHFGKLTQLLKELEHHRD